MGNVTNVVMMTVHKGPDELGNLGFVPIPEVSYGYYFEGKISDGVDGLIERLKTLDWWPAKYTEVHLHLLWTDDYTGQDDSWSGRVSPYSANHELVVIPKRSR